MTLYVQNVNMNGTMHLKDLCPFKEEPIIGEEIVELEEEE